ncbi:hypothetical protein ACCO45_000862 [Purpureocillium lilacinum]|uniref:Uncharacterized protein n=1 Tax=Purpureocillium lilacinum TaxID=33203 RepID=A0ACC4E6L4_PURLI
MAEAHSVSIYFARGAFEADTQTAANSAMLTPAPPLQGEGSMTGPTWQLSTLDDTTSFTGT